MTMSPLCMLSADSAGFVHAPQRFCMLLHAMHASCMTCPRNYQKKEKGLSWRECQWPWACGLLDTSHDCCPLFGTARKAMEQAVLIADRVAEAEIVGKQQATPQCSRDLLILFYETLHFDSRGKVGLVIELRVTPTSRLVVPRCPH